MRADRVLGFIAPGLAQLVRERSALGAFMLLVWVSHLSLLILRRDRVVEAWGGDLGARISVVALVVAPALAWIWAYRRGAHAEAGGAEGQWAIAARSFARNRLAVLGAILIAFAYLAALLAPILAPHDPNLIPLDQDRMLPPGGVYPLGTDERARDILSRLLFGARISLSIGFVAVGISVTIGTLVGAVAGFAGGRVDTLLMRFVDLVLAFPRLILLITIIALFEQSIFLIVAVLGLTQWPGTARIVRGEVLSLREREFVEAARALGFRGRRIVFRHLIPNALAPVIVAATLGIGNTIVLEAGLSFLGLGVPAPTASWGTMLEGGKDVIASAWWITTFPGLAIVFTVVAFNLVGDGLRDALDPRLRT